MSNDHVWQNVGTVERLLLQRSVRDTETYLKFQTFEEEFGTISIKLLLSQPSHISDRPYA